MNHNTSNTSMSVLWKVDFPQRRTLVVDVQQGGREVGKKAGLALNKGSICFSRFGGAAAIWHHL